MRPRRRVRIPPLRPRAHPSLDEFLASIGVPPVEPFEPDPFQIEAVEAIERADCLVTAPTGAGKTWIAEQAMAHALARGKRSWYASPLKALSNSKYAEFIDIFGADRVGILTGDRKENVDAPVIVGTTEILRNQLYDAMHLGEDLSTDLVVLDEVHFMGDLDRGVVWEETMIYLPARIPLLMLSATIGNAPQIAHWLQSIRSRECIVVEESERPVDLCLLFLHPSGTLYPLLHTTAKGRKVLDKHVRAYTQLRDPPLLARPRQLPPFDQVLNALRKHHLIPAIVFLKSRADCDRAISLCRARPASENEELRRRMDELAAANPHIAHHRQRGQLESKGVGAHHGGQLPAWKLVLETLMTEGLLDAVFATSTVSAGVNFPARSIVLLNSDRYDGHGFVPLTPTEFHQMTGRAGRRGMDNIGFGVILPGEHMDLQAVASLAIQPPSDVLSQVQISFSMVLNLLLSHTPEQIVDLLSRSFATYTASKGQVKRLMHNLNRHVGFLKERGYVTTAGTLTDAGTWASQLRVDQPLLIAESLRKNVLPRTDPALLAAIVASFVNEQETDDRLAAIGLPKKLERAFVSADRALQSLMAHMASWGFVARPLYLRPAVTLYDWARGRTWEQVLMDAGLADGDLAMLITRTADNLRHIRTLDRVFPDVAATADQAVEAIVREPVAWTYQ
jgi:ATP-dependent RNA helicase HelY